MNQKKKSSYNTYCATAIGLVVSPQASQLWCWVLLSLLGIKKFQLVRWFSDSKGQILNVVHVTLLLLLLPGPVSPAWNIQIRQQITQF